MRNLLKITTLALTAALAMTMPAYAVIIEFTSVGVPPGDNGGVSFITVVSGTDASGADLAISQMIVSGDGAFDGTYSVTGGVAGFGDLTFDTSLNSVTIVGGVPFFSVPNGTTLLTGTGLFSNIVVTAPNCVAIPSHLCPTVSFDTTSALDASLLTALGISGTFDLSSFDTAEGSGNGFPQVSADVVNTQVVSDIPEPTTLFLLGTGLFGLGLMRRRKRISRASGRRSAPPQI